MIGWVIFVGLAVVVALALWWVRRPDKAAWQLIAAALLIAAAGYAWQGHPALGGDPVSAEDKTPSPTAMVFAAERGAWMDAVGPDADVLTSADSWLASVSTHAGGNCVPCATTVTEPAGHTPASAPPPVPPALPPVPPVLPPVPVPPPAAPPTHRPPWHD